MKHAKIATQIRRGVVVLAALSLIGTACSGSASDSTTDTDTLTSIDEVTTDSVADTEVPATEPAPDETGSPVISASDGVAPAPDGFVFTSPDGDYTITFPGEPTSTPLPVALPTGQVTAEAFIYEDGTNAAYFTSVFEYAEGTTDDDPEVVLTGARDGAVANVNGTLVDSEFVEVDGVPGVSFFFTVTGGGGQALVLFEDSRLYQSFVLGNAGQSEVFGDFLDSFMFTGATTSTTAAGDS